MRAGLPWVTWSKSLHLSGLLLICKEGPGTGLTAEGLHMESGVWYGGCDGKLGMEQSSPTGGPPWACPWAKCPTSRWDSQLSWVVTYLLQTAHRCLW